jgi:large repetitive protein
VRTFRTAIAPPTLSSPADLYTTATDRKPVFDWADMAGASNYTIQVSKNSAFTSLVVNATATTSTYTPVTNLPVGTLYWRVKANGANGPSLWSVTRTLIEQ